MKRSPTSPIAAALFVSALACATGCGSQCDRHPDDSPIVWKGGTTDATGYSSANPNGPYLDFPPGRTYRFEHALGGIPKIISVRFSFNPFPFDGGTNSAGAVLAGGNQATIQHQCGTYFDLRNDTCSEVYIWVSASDPIPMSANACPSDEGAAANPPLIDASAPVLPDAGARMADSGTD